MAADECQQAIDARSKAQTAATDATKNAQQKQQAVITATQMLKVAQDALESATVSPCVVNNDNTGSINRVDLMMAQLVTILGKCNEETLKTNMELAKSQQSAKQAELAKETEKSDKIAEKQKGCIRFWRSRQSTYGCDDDCWCHFCTIYRWRYGNFVCCQHGSHDIGSNHESCNGRVLYGESDECRCERTC